MPTIEAKVYVRGVLWNLEMYHNGSAEGFWTISIWQIGWTLKASRISASEDDAKGLLIQAMLHPEQFYAARIK